MAKQQSFAEKAAKKKKKDLSTYVKYIKSVKSEKTGYWRFNEQMIEVKTGENLDGALKRMDEVAQVFNMEIPVIEAAADVDTVEQDGADESKDPEQAADDNGQEESADVVAEESVTEVNEPAAVEKENDADETAEPATEVVGTVTEKQAEDADASGKDTPAKADEST